MDKQSAHNLRKHDSGEHDMGKRDSGEHDMGKRDWREETHLIRAGLDRSPHGETAEALYLTSGFTYPDPETAERRFAAEEEGYVYSRYGNPTVTVFEERLRRLEDAEACYATASGMSAVFGALASQLNPGDRIVASRALFASCRKIIGEILPRFGIDYAFVDGTDVDEWARALEKKTRVVFMETPANPNLDLIDIKDVADITHRAGAMLVVDNAFASPILQKPIHMGADIVIHSATKHIDGQGRCLGGAILCTQEFKEETLKPFLRHIGPSISPFNAWVLLKGMETLKIRIIEQSNSALQIARAMGEMAGIESVLYPKLHTHPHYHIAEKQMTHGGTIITFFLKGGKARAFRFLRALQLIDISNNLGDTKSLITHPASTTHRAIAESERRDIGITDSMLRLSVGLEHMQDIIRDLNEAAEKSLEDV